MKTAWIHLEIDGKWAVRYKKITVIPGRVHYPLAVVSTRTGFATAEDAFEWCALNHPDVILQSEVEFNSHNTV